MALVAGLEERIFRPSACGLLFVLVYISASTSRQAVGGIPNLVSLPRWGDVPGPAVDGVAGMAVGESYSFATPSVESLSFSWHLRVCEVWFTGVEGPVLLNEKIGQGSLGWSGMNCFNSMLTGAWLADVLAFPFFKSVFFSVLY